MKGKYIAIIGIILFIFGFFIAGAGSWWGFLKKGPMGLLRPNETLVIIGLLMAIVGGVITFYGRYKYTKEEEKEEIEKQKEDRN